MRSININNVKESSAAFLLSASFLKRSITVLILAPLGLWMLYLGYPYSLGLFSLLFIGLLVEWSWLIWSSTLSRLKKIVSLVSGTFYISTGLWGFYHFYSQSPLKGMVLLLVIWGTDIGAYFVGQFLRGPKLWPQVSPQKTWSGSVGGFVVAACIVLTTSYIHESFRSLPLITLYIGLSIVGQIGDLLESAVKRSFQIKDTSKLLPGHGGLLDRFDSTLAVGIILWILSTLHLV
jgi:phosphatidate cytidylyltransferase